MKKLFLISAVCLAISGVAYASSKEDCNGAAKFVANLNLDEARAYEVEQILSSYKEVKDLAMSGRHSEIPVFIEEMNTHLSQVLTEEEFQQFKENVGEWADKMDFSKFANYAEKSDGQGYR